MQWKQLWTLTFHDRYKVSYDGHLFNVFASLQKKHSREKCLFERLAILTPFFWIFKAIVLSINLISSMFITSKKILYSLKWFLAGSFQGNNPFSLSLIKSCKKGWSTSVKTVRCQKMQKLVKVLLFRKYLWIEITMY